MKFQYSIRTLLILMLLVGIFTSISVQFYHRVCIKWDENNQSAGKG
jgi:hypothetical protein